MSRDEVSRLRVARPDRPLTAAEIAEATAHYARSAEHAAPAPDNALVVRIGREWLGVPSRLVDEVVEDRHVHPLPDAAGRPPARRRGLVNIRGDLVVHLSLAAVLGIDPASAAGSTRRLIVIGVDRSRLAFTVDEVLGFVRYDAAALRGVPSTLDRTTALTIGMIAEGERVIGVLDGAAVLRALEAGIA